jgi:hypothetical protein
MPTTPKQAKHLEFDSPWKDILEHYFEAFLQLFFPALHAQVDWTKGYEFLDRCAPGKAKRRRVAPDRRTDTP